MGCQPTAGFMNTLDSDLMLDLVGQNRGYLLVTDDIADTLPSDLAAVPIEPKEELRTVLAYSSRRPLNGLREEFSSYISRAMGR